MKMNSITLTYTTKVTKTVTLDYTKFAPKDKKFLQAWLKDEEDRTPQDWSLINKNDFTKVIKKYTGDEISWGDYVEIIH